MGNTFNAKRQSSSLSSSNDSSKNYFEKGSYGKPKQETIRLVLALLFDDKNIARKPYYDKLKLFAEMFYSRHNSLVLHRYNDEFASMCQEYDIDIDKFGDREVIIDCDTSIYFSDDFKNKPEEITEEKLKELYGV